MFSLSQPKSYVDRTNPISILEWPIVATFDGDVDARMIPGSTFTCPAKGRSYWLF